MTHRFPHHRLIVFARSMELSKLACSICRDIPRGHRKLADQLLRSGSAVTLLIAEGANRYSRAQKRQRYVEARGECGEAAAAVELLCGLELVSASKSARFLQAADEVGAMLCALIRRHS